jgi:hypothetical protein
MVVDGLSAHRRAMTEMGRVVVFFRPMAELPTSWTALPSRLQEASMVYSAEGGSTGTKNDAAPAVCDASPAPALEAASCAGPTDVSAQPANKRNRHPIEINNNFDRTHMEPPMLILPFYYKTISIPFGLFLFCIFRVRPSEDVDIYKLNALESPFFGLRASFLALIL